MTSALRPMTDFQIASEDFDLAAELMNLDEVMRVFLRTPQKEIRVDVPLVIEPSHTASFIGYLVRHNSARGPCLAGLRLHPADRIGPDRGDRDPDRKGGLELLDGTWLRSIELV